MTQGGFIGGVVLVKWSVLVGVRVLVFSCAGNKHVSATDVGAGLRGTRRLGGVGTTLAVGGLGYYLSSWPKCCGIRYIPWSLVPSLQNWRITSGCRPADIRVGGGLLQQSPG